MRVEENATQNPRLDSCLLWRVDRLLRLPVIATLLYHHYVAFYRSLPCNRSVVRLSVSVVSVSISGFPSNVHRVDLSSG